jgi:hypothetical protein
VVSEDRNESGVDVRAEYKVRRTHSPVCELKIGGWCASEDEIHKGGARTRERNTQWRLAVISTSQVNIKGMLC